MSAILRHRHPNRFTVLPNDAIRNPALSFRAVGVLAHLLSLPDGAKVDSATLAQAHKEGRDAVRAAYKELEAHGYYRRQVIRLPDGTLRTEVVVSSTPMDGEGPGRTGAGKSGVGPEPEDPASAGPAPADPTSVAPTPVDQATTEVPTTQELIPPQPPRPAGGQEVDQGSAGPRRIAAEPDVRAGTPGCELPPDAASGVASESAGATSASGEAPGWAVGRGPAAIGGRRRAGTNPRTLGTHPRADAELAEAARLEAEARRRQAELELTTEARRAADRAADREAERLEAEAAAISAALDDDRLPAVVALASTGLSGLLAGSTVAVTRAVVAWCRTADATFPGPFNDAVTAGLAASLTAGEGQAPLALPTAPPDTAPLRSRIAAVLKRRGASV